MRLTPRVEGQHAVQLKIDGRQGAATSQAVFEIRGGGGGSGGVNPPPPITAQDPGICAFQGDPGCVPKRPPPPKYQNVFYKLFLKLLNVTRNKTCHRKLPIIKTVNCPGSITSQKHFITHLVYLLRCDWSIPCHVVQFILTLLHATMV